VKKISHFVAGIFLGLLLAWLLGLFDPASISAIEPSIPKAAAPGAPKPVITTVSATHANVVMPTAPAVPAHGPDPASAKAIPKTPAANSDFSQVALPSQQRKAATNNLRMLGSAAPQYMVDHGVTSASYHDLVGTETDDYIRSITPASDEDYTDIIIFQAQTQISISAESFGTITYNL